MSKTCFVCKSEKPLSEFKHDKFSYCKSCTLVYERRRWNNLSEKERRSKWLKTKYKISYEEYESMYKKQNGKCAVCEIEISIEAKKSGNETACVDHNHETGKIRGLLCNHCNRALGLLKESEQSIIALLNYVRRFNG